MEWGYSFYGGLLQIIIIVVYRYLLSLVSYPLLAMIIFIKKLTMTTWQTFFYPTERESVQGGLDSSGICVLSKCTYIIIVTLC